jgi:hypothetical protein
MYRLSLCLRIFISCVVQSFFLLRVGIILHLNGKMASDIFIKVRGIKQLCEQAAGAIVFVPILRFLEEAE